MHFRRESLVAQRSTRELPSGLRWPAEEDTVVRRTRFHEVTEQATFALPHPTPEFDWPDVDEDELASSGRLPIALWTPEGVHRRREREERQDDEPAD